MARTLHSLDDKVKVYSDDSMAFLYLAGRSAVQLPFIGGSAGGYLPSTDEIVSQLRSGQAIVVLFADEGYLDPDLWGALRKKAVLRVLMKDRAGVIYGSLKQ